jgi:5-methyltetrahydropteroyltriglutamate--homocysteine methyltransferase
MSANSLQSHILGYPRIGSQRELKRAVESFWKGTLTENDLLHTANELKRKNWQTQKDAGLSHVATGDFSFYDHVLDTVMMLGAIPPRYQTVQASLELYFHMARGDEKRNIPAMTMTKWFDTNYHYIVPEFTPNMPLGLQSQKFIDETAEAAKLGFLPKPVLLGPITFLSLAKDDEGANRWERTDEIAALYCTIIRELRTVMPAGADWIQIDEPILCTDISDEARNAFAKTYARLTAAAPDIKLLLATYFGSASDNLELALSSGCAGLHVDLVRGAEQLDTVLEKLPKTMSLSAGVVEGRNIWRNDFTKSRATLRRIESKIGKERLIVASSCSLLHSPVDLASEQKLDAELKSWMAFAVQKCSEVSTLRKLLDNAMGDDVVEANAKIIASRKTSPRVVDSAVQKRVASMTPEMLKRKGSYAERKKAQDWLKLPLFPTTTIGSFPQTATIREFRQKYRKGEITATQYELFLQNTVKDVVHRQEELGLDVLVHGEAERNDMVEYFGEQLNGFCFTENAWVQSYGSRCVKPPIIFGDVSRKQPMTIQWIQYAQSCTSKPMKGMLTGPVTILCWSFVRDDIPRGDVCYQIGFAIRDEVIDLEKAGIGIIQIDEAALREGLPLRKKDAEQYLQWATDSFRLASSGVSDRIQIHSHMCYSQFNTIIRWIARMDADVISIESSRSKMQLLESFKEFEYPNEIGPGIYDIHSPRVPTQEEMIALLEKALQYVPKDRLWVNPDCGLKTRDWKEVMESLKNLVAAAKRLR